MSEPFGPGYAAEYDALYRDKDYPGECDLLERVFATHATAPVRSVLDLGCGTGMHTRELIKRGYDVVGVDRSTAMLDRARRADPEAQFVEDDIRSLDLGRHFDAVVLLFAVLGYQLADDDLLATLRSARRHLAPGGLLGFDVWYGPAVVAQRPSVRTKEVADGVRRLERRSSGTLNLSRHTVSVEFELAFADGEGPRVTETHEMRYFFGDELDGFLDRSGFEPVRIGAFPSFDDEPDDTTWNVFALARAT